MNELTADKPVLVLDASTYRGSAAVVLGSRVLASTFCAMRGAREERLMPALAKAMEDARVSAVDLGAVVCGAGPGSFTSLRIAGALAKGMSTGLGVPLYSVSSLALLVAAERRPAGKYLGLIDALRGEYFAARVEIDTAGRITGRVIASLVAAAEIAPLCDREGLVPVGVDSEGVERPDAAALVHLVDTGAAPLRVPIAEWEPDYGRLAEAQAKWEREHGMPLSEARYPRSSQ